MYGNKPGFVKSIDNTNVYTKDITYKCLQEKQHWWKMVLKFKKGVEDRN